MTEYVAIPDSDLEPGDGIKSEHALAFNNNLLALNEMDPTAIAAGAFPAGPWLIEDGAGGANPFYDFAVDGVQSSVTSPNFLAGYDYRIFIEAVTHNHTGSSDPQFQWFRETTGSLGNTFRPLFPDGAFDPGVGMSGFVQIDLPYRTAEHHIYNYSVSSLDIGAGVTHAEFAPVTSGIHKVTNPQRLSAFALSFINGDVNGGKIYLFKRKRQDY